MTGFDQEYKRIISQSPEHAGGLNFVRETRGAQEVSGGFDVRKVVSGLQAENPEIFPAGPDGIPKRYRGIL
jgi:hypothetical protein